jgi:membrane protein
MTPVTPVPTPQGGHAGDRPGHPIRARHPGALRQTIAATGNEERRNDVRARRLVKARDVRRRAASGVAWGRAQGDRVMQGVPAARRLVSELLRVEVVDRSMALAAQALLALVPLLVVAAAFLPEAAIEAAYERLQAVTGIQSVQTSQLAESVTTGVDVGQVRAQVGLIGLAITVFSATSYARATQRAYEKVWALHHRGGWAGRKRAFVWLLGWLVGLQTIAAVDRLVGGGSRAPVELAGFVLRAGLMALLWWWSLHYLLSNRLRWSSLVPAAALTGVAVVAYAAGSTLVMPTFARSSAEEFGAFGLVLTLATWLVGLSGVQVVSAVIGRVVAEDRAVGVLTRRTIAALRDEAARLRRRD